MFQAEIHFRGLRTLRTLFSTAHGKSKRGVKKGLERKRAEGISLRTVRSPESSSVTLASSEYLELLSHSEQFLIENIKPDMTEQQEKDCWAAIQRAIGIEPNNRRYRNE